VTTIEGVNARYLNADALPPGAAPFDLITIDVSFISLRQILPVVPALLTDDGHVIALVKPQFEAGRREVGAGGIVRDPLVHRRVVEEIVAAALTVGLERIGLEPSPIEGAEGNREFLLCFARGPLR
jgi:23S rRNA (cytidine1920-2'-O)/16S rRNA (cytidine1409-2'-O)-methyltransferase